MLKPAYTRSAQKAVGAMPKGDAAQLVSRINAYAADAKTPNIDVDSVKGRPGVYRIRWGRWRALFRVENGEMRIYQIEHRREVYR
jgi:mRNA-degrading endonuclease RelE of RelBE toxin-antitoxin system